MDPTELAGAIVAGQDVDDRADRLGELLLRRAGSEEVRAADLDDALFRRLDNVLPPDPAVRTLAVERGRAWAKGRASVRCPEPWETVLSTPGSGTLPEGTRRRTAETWISLLTDARRRARFLVGYTNTAGMEHLADALVGALSRRVTVEFTVSDVDDPWTARAARWLLDLSDQHGLPPVQLYNIRPGSAWPHMKALTVDGRHAYVGSANLTAAALAGGNVELGVLLRGEQVAAIDAVIDSLESDDYVPPRWSNMPATGGEGPHR